MEYVEFTLRYGDNEKHIHQRLECEKRCGSDENSLTVIENSGSVYRLQLLSGHIHLCG